MNAQQQKRYNALPGPHNAVYDAISMRRVCEPYKAQDAKRIATLLNMADGLTDEQVSKLGEFHKAFVAYMQTRGPVDDAWTAMEEAAVAAGLIEAWPSIVARKGAAAS